MGSDSDDGYASDEARGYSDEEEPEVGCMGVKNPREHKKRISMGKSHLYTAAWLAIFLAIGAVLPHALLALLGASSAVPSDAVLKSGPASNIALPPSGAAAKDAPTKGILPRGSESIAKVEVAAHPTLAGGAEAWGKTSNQIRDALRALIQNGTVTLEPMWLDEELADTGLVFASGLGSCDAVCKVGGSDKMCSKDWFPFLNDCTILRTAFPRAKGCLQHMYGRDLPAFSDGLGSLTGAQVMVNADLRQYQTRCDAVGDHSLRLCACRDRVKKQDKDLHVRLSKVALRQLRQLHVQITKGDKELKASKEIHGSLNEFWYKKKQKQNAQPL